MDYYTLNADGSYTKVTENLVPERDVLAVKGSKETLEKQSSERIDSLTKDLDTMTTRATSAESELSSIKTELEPLKIEAAKVPELMTQISTLTEKSSTAITQLLTTKRQAVIDKYALDGDKKAKVEAMDEAALTSFSEALDTVGFKPGNGNNSSFNNAPPKGSDTSGMSGEQKMRLGLEQGLLAVGKE